MIKNLSLSTSWNSFRHDNGDDLINEIKGIGFDTVELNFSLTKKIADDVLEIKKAGRIKVSSLHNMCPLPDEISPKNPSPDHYSLASPVEEERAHAVQIAKNTMDYAQLFGARAIVVHAGRVEMKEGMRELASLLGERLRFEAYRKELMEERSGKKNRYLDSAIKSLSELSSYAKAKKICIGIENRYHYREIPLLEEFEEIFRIFPSTSNLYYWHDVGHAEVFERLGFYRNDDLLKRFGARLLGVHMHDIIGAIDDHKAPGFGTFDFNRIKPYIKSDTIKVMEVHRPVTAEEILKGIEHLDKIFR